MRIWFAGIAIAGILQLSAPEAIARRWHAALEQHRTELLSREGEENFAGLQRFLACVHRLSAERRLSRYCYLAEKPIDA